MLPNQQHPAFPGPEQGFQQMGGMPMPGTTGGTPMMPQLMGFQPQAGMLSQAHCLQTPALTVMQGRSLMFPGASGIPTHAWCSQPNLHYQQFPQLPDMPRQIPAALHDAVPPADEPVVKTSADDKVKLSTAYRMLGAVWRHGVRATIPKKLRGSCINHTDPDTWTVYRLSQIDDVQTDCLLYMICGMKPTTRISDLCCKNKGELKGCIKLEAKRIQKAQPERMSGLAHDLNNVVQEAVRLGFDINDLPDGARSAFLPHPAKGPSLQNTLSIEDGCESSSESKDGGDLAEGVAVPRPEELLQRRICKKRKVATMEDKKAAVSAMGLAAITLTPSTASGKQVANEDNNDGSTSSISKGEGNNDQPMSQGDEVAQKQLAQFIAKENQKLVQARENELQALG